MSDISAEQSRKILLICLPLSYLILLPAIISHWVQGLCSRWSHRDLNAAKSSSSLLFSTPSRIPLVCQYRLWYSEIQARSYLGNWGESQPRQRLDENQILGQEEWTEQRHEVVAGCLGRRHENQTARVTKTIELKQKPTLWGRKTDEMKRGKGLEKKHKCATPPLWMLTQCPGLAQSSMLWMSKKSQTQAPLSPDNPLLAKKLKKIKYTNQIIFVILTYSPNSFFSGLSPVSEVPDLIRLSCQFSLSNALEPVSFFSWLPSWVRSSTCLIKTP